MANQSANHFTLAGGGIKGTVDTTSFTGGPAIDITVDGQQVTGASLADTENGFEVTAVVEQVPDSRTVRLVLLVPHVNLVDGKPKRFTGVGILATARTTIGGEPLVDGVVHRYDVRSVNGTAEVVDS
jgi:hypothetical protein